MTRQIPAKVAESGVKILKLHGSLKGVSSFVFARVDLVAYPKEIATTVEDLTGGDILVCGYDYNDQCVISCFSKDGKGNVAIVNPKPPQMLLDVAAKRKGQFVFPSKFDDFFDHLAAALLHGGETPTPPPKRNPYKFLEAYRVEDRESFSAGRRQSRRRKRSGSCSCRGRAR